MKQVFLSTALVVSLLGCTHNADMKQSVTEQPSPHGIRSGSQVSAVPVNLSTGILGSWKLMSVSGDPVASDQLSIKFQAGFFDANVNCNRVSGFYALRADTFIPDKAVATERGCGPKYPFDTMLTRALQFGMTLTMPSKDRLVAQVGKQQLIFVRL